MKKKLLSLALAGVMVLGLCACGGETSEETSTEGTETTSTAQGAAFKIGGTGPLTGTAAIYGIAAKNGAQIAVDEINALGGDIQFELRYEDDVHDAEKAVNAYNTLKDWGMQLSLGSVTSKPAEATSAGELFRPHLCPDPLRLLSRPSSTARTTSIRCASPTPTRAPLPPSTSPSRAWAPRSPSSGRTTTCIPRASTTPSWTEAGTRGLEIVSDTTFTDGNDTDFSVQLADAQSAGADLVFLPIYYHARLPHPVPGQGHGLRAQVVRRGRHGRHPDHGRL